MVRFSDMLGGNEPPADKAPAPAEVQVPADPAPAAADAPEDDDSPEDVLERLTQFATSARTPDPADEPVSPASFRDVVDVVPDAEPDAPPAIAPFVDDLLPRSKGRKKG
jgi:hypothetical protein